MIAKQFTGDTMILMVDKHDYELISDALAIAYNETYPAKVKDQDDLALMFNAEEWEDLMDEMPVWEDDHE